LGHPLALPETWRSSHVAALAVAAGLLGAMGLSVRLGMLARGEVVSFLQEAQDAHEATRRAYAEHEREVTDLMAEIAHELRNPLTTIKGTAAMMARNAQDGRNAERLEMLRGEAERMRELLEQFVTFSRPLSPLRPEIIDLPSLCREVIVLHEAIAAERAVQLV